MHVVQINKILFDIKCSKTQLEKSLFFEKSFVQNKIDQTKENLGQYILNPLLYIEGTIARDVRGDKE